jgi:type VI secretion system protein ImpF
MSELSRSAAIPLFQRLCARDGEMGDAAAFDAAGLQASIANEIASLLNTRCGLTMADFLKCQGTVLDFGIPDFSSLSCKSSEDLALVSQAVQHAIALFEPRLSHTQVVAIHDDSINHRGQAKLQISGAVRLGMTLRRVDFDIPVNLSDGVSETV